MRRFLRMTKLFLMLMPLMLAACTPGSSQNIFDEPGSGADDSIVLRVFSDTGGDREMTLDVEVIRDWDDFAVNGWSQRGVAHVSSSTELQWILEDPTVIALRWNVRYGDPDDPDEHFCYGYEETAEFRGGYTLTVDGRSVEAEPWSISFVNSSGDTIRGCSALSDDFTETSTTM